MKLDNLNHKFISFAAAISLALAGTVFAIPRAQSNASASSSANAASSTEGAASAAKGMQSLRSGTKISTELESTLDARTAKPGQEVKARVTKNVKQHGRTVIRKGDTLVGHVTKVQPSAYGSAGSAIGVAFDQLQSRGGATTQLNTVVTSVFSAEGQGGLSTEPMSMPEAAPVPMSTGRAGGGLLGGVGSTARAVGGTAGGLGRTLSSSTGSALGGSANAGLATPLRAIQLSSGADADSSSMTNSTLSTRRGNLRLNSGTEMQFQVAGSAQAGKANQRK